MPTLKVIFRTCPFLSKKYALNNLSKHESLDLTLGSLCESLKDSDFEIVDFVVVLDGDVSYDFRFLQESLGVPVREVHARDSGNYASFQRVLNEAMKGSAEYVFLCEDDYFYDPACFQTIADVTKKLRSQESSDWFLTPYWHENYDLTQGSWLSKQRLGAIRSDDYDVYAVPSTTLTFFAPSSSLERYSHFLYLFAFGVPDYKIWKDITRTKRLSFFDLFFPIPVALRLLYLKLLLRLPKRGLAESGAVLYAVQPSLSQHLCVEESISPLLSPVAEETLRRIYNDHR